MDSELSLCETNLQFHFVTKNGQPDAKLKDLTMCYEKIAERFQLAEQCLWISESECIRLASTMLTNRSVFVFAKFETPAFEKLRHTEAMILGPQCIISCLVNEFGVPNTHSPVFNVWLRERLVCSSNLNGAEKSKIQRLVQFLGGSFQVTELTQATSHLVTNTVMSQKYEQAAINNIKIVTPDWVYHLWEQSCRGDPLDASTLSELDARFRVPIFNKLGISSTGISGAKKTQLTKLIESNGGKFFGAFKSELIDVLIATEEHTASDKFRAAIKCRKMCLTPEWIIESVSKGYALPIEAYRLEVPSSSSSLGRKKLLGSTPTKHHSAVNESAFNADCTNLSEIIGNITVNESVAVASVKQKENSYKVVLANINVQQAKKAGSFLDGCNIFLAGFTADEKEKIGKILGSSNATRFQELSSRVEYAIIGHPSSAELQLLSAHKNCNLVTLDWLVACIAEKQPANEQLYPFKLSNHLKASPDQEQPTVASPASKKNIQSMNKSMNNTFRKPLVPRRLDMVELTDENDDQANAESDLLQQYLVAKPDAHVAAPAEPSIPAANVTNKASNSSDGLTNQTHQTHSDGDTLAENADLLNGLTFHLHGFVEDSEEELESDIALVGGRVVPESYPGVVDYLLVPTDIMQLTIKLRAKNIVNENWIEDVCNNQEIVDIEYYHKPFFWDETCVPLTGLTIVLTTYSGSERKYLMHVAQTMGATVIDRYVKNMAPILICPKPEGAKYNGAIKWKLPVVNCEWLILCSKTKRKLPMRPFLVGTSIVPPGEAADELADELETGPITSTANPLVGIDRPANMPNDVSPIRPVEQAESSVERLKRQRPDDFAPPQTPVLKHRRLSELGGGYASGSNSPMLTQSPQISIDDMMRELVSDLPTPQRDYILSCRRVKDNETPETRRRMDAISTPDLLRSPLPKEWQTPARQKRMAAIDSMHILPPLPTPPPSTPYAEISRRFWKKALGEQYVSPTQQLSQNTTIIEPEPTMGGAGSTQAVAASSAAAHAQLKRLSDFIENNKGTGDKTPLKQVEVPDSMAINTQAGGEINSEGNEVVGWLDPTDFYENHRIRKRGAMQHVGTPRFNISYCDPVMLERIMTLIVELKGTICENRSGYDPTCTHVVCEKPSRSEKIFSAIAAGKWLLAPKYILESAEAGYFLNEEAWEWGNPKASENVPCVDQIGRAAHRWRKQLQAKAASSNSTDKVGAFSNFRVILHSRKKDAFRNLLEAGGGCLLDVSEPFESSKEALTATHCIVDTKCRLSPLDHKALKRANVHCVSIAFLQEYITADTPPNPEDFAI